MTRRLSLFLGSLLATTAAAQTGGVALADAVAAAVQRSPSVAAAGQSVLTERAALRAASSAFEPHLYGSAGGGQVESPLTSVQRAGASATTVGQGYQRYEVGVRRQFRSGLELTPLVQMTRTNPDATAAVVETTAGLSLAYPVLGGRARNVALASEEAALQRVDAAGLDRARAEELAMADVARAYWQYVGVARVEAALRTTEERAERLLADTEALVAADERPAADLVPLRADLARRRSARMAASQSVFEARQQLGLAMGGSADEAAGLGRPLDALPEVPAEVALDEARLVALAMRQRTDLQALALRVRSLDREADALRADLRPSVDVVVDAGYTALSEGDGLPYQYLPLGIGAVRGGRLGLSVRVNRLGNSATLAAAERQRATVTRAEIQRDDLARRIRADVAGAVASLRSSAAQTAQTRATVALYEEAVVNERQRLRLGMGTLFDVQITEERLSNAQTAAVEAEVRYAQALVQLHAALGTPPAAGADALRFPPAP